MTLEKITIFRRSNRAKLIVVVAWMALVLLAMSLDRSVAIDVRHAHLDSALRGKWLTALVKFPGTFWFTLLLVVVCVALKTFRIREGMFVLFAGAMSGVNWLIKWMIGRSRPFRYPGPHEPYPFNLQPFERGIVGLFSQKNLSFPSGHTCTAFALATAVLLIRPRWAWVFFVLAVIVGAERVCENAHYVSDVVAGAGMGSAGSLVAHYLMKRAYAHRPISGTAGF